ncbi:flagellar basal-body MS-ring/collar protein FliF [Aquisalibacillus elongatus]|uniref:Flagellar M-ring protein n=1 Tax=Aquisalibacillus elongatus TaxID=485577 RepID=A0A3N5C1N9_9BACI|nr:flagellar basal-body MS-ring/collar protein FliF [Aquisalibacillus elongatus]RPF55998.1 flagellar M-ring protein FliF [Aquisalibacillus elongatus]
MNETVQQYKNKIVDSWKERTKPQKIGIIGGTLGIIFVLILITVLLSSSNMVPIYNDLSPEEAGQLTEELDNQGVNYELENGGTTVLVPEQEADRLVVELAAQGIPNSGDIDFSFFSANVSWGMTDEERQIIERDALQTELSQLITTIDGVEGAKVLINQPTESVFVGDQPEESSASIVLNTSYNQSFEQGEIQSLYHLVSKAVDNLPTENIVIMNQYSEYYDLEQANSSGSGNTYAEHQQIKRDIERDLQRRVQRLLGSMIGQQKVVVSVTANVDTTSENRVEELVEPVDLENMEGLPVSIDRVTETYTGYDGSDVTQGEVDVPQYLAEENPNELSEYENVKETINNEFNRIRREIVESPYEIRDLGIQVAVDNSVEETDGEEVTLSDNEQLAVEEDIQSILSSMIETSVSSDVVNNNEAFNPEDKISIAFQPFNNEPVTTQSEPAIPTWVYIVGAVLILLIILLIYLMLRKKPATEEVSTEATQMIDEVIDDLPTEEEQSESAVRRKQLEKMAKENPEEFAKLLRTWISED